MKLWRPRLFGELIGLWFARLVVLIAIGPTIERIGPGAVSSGIVFLVAWILPALVLVWIVVGETKRNPFVDSKKPAPPASQGEE